MSEPTEAELARRISRGDKVAFEAVLTAHLPSVSRYIARMLSNPSEAEDIAQEVFLRLWTGADSFDPDKARLTTWLHRIAHNLAIDHLRKSGRLVADTSAESASGDIELIEPAPAGPEAQRLRAQTADAVSEALMTLPERQRSALVLTHYQGISNRDAAGMLDVTTDALESLLRRGRKKLKETLSGRLDRDNDK